MSGLSEDELLAPVPQGRYAKGVIKREAILDAALEVFSQVGFQGSTLREIARKCGVSHQSLMHYFPSKQELLIAVLHRRDERLRRHFDDPAGMAVGELIALAEYNAVGTRSHRAVQRRRGRGDGGGSSRPRVLRAVLPFAGQLHDGRTSPSRTNTGC